MLTYRDISWTASMYSVSNNGIVRSNPRDVKYSNGTVAHHKGKELKPYCDKGYLRVVLSINNKPIKKSIHQLVAEAFIPNPLRLKYVNHKDGNRSNNSVENLEWCTASQNEIHSYEVLGKVNANRKLSDLALSEIIKSNERASVLAEKFSVDVKTIYNARNGSTYKTKGLSVKDC